MSMFFCRRNERSRRASPWLRSILTSKKLVLDAKGCNPSSAVETPQTKTFFPFQPTLGLGREARVLKTRQRHIQCRAIDGPGFLISRELSDLAGFPSK